MALWRYLIRLWFTSSSKQATRISNIEVADPTFRCLFIYLPPSCCLSFLFFLLLLLLSLLLLLLLLSSSSSSSSSSSRLCKQLVNRHPTASGLWCHPMQNHRSFKWSMARFLQPWRGPCPLLEISTRDMQGDTVDGSEIRRSPVDR